MNNYSRNTITKIDVTRGLPPVLQQDPDMVAAAQVIGAQLQENVRLSRLNLIYHRIDELDEEKLDILAYDLHVDWYDYSHPVPTKRRVIKDSVKVHKYLGTRYAVETALGNVYPRSHVEEWFEYGGRPFYFRAVLDVTDPDIPASYSIIKKTVALYKRLTAHLEEIVFQGSTDIAIIVETQVFKYTTGTTGQYPAGTKPFQLVAGGQGSETIAIIPDDGNGYTYEAPRSGTVPERATKLHDRETVIIAREEVLGLPYTPGLTGEYNAGTRPDRAAVGDSIRQGVSVHPEQQEFSISPPITGTRPERNRVGDSLQQNVQIEPDPQGFGFVTTPAGTQPGRALTGGGENGSVEIQAEAQPFQYTPPPAGTVPDHQTGSGANKKGVRASAQTDSFNYPVKRCGTDICKNQ